MSEVYLPALGPWTQLPYCLGNVFVLGSLEVPYTYKVNGIPLLVASLF